MKLSVIVPCYNAEDTLALELDALARQEWSEPWEILLVDNRSTDRSRAIAEEYADRLPNMRVIDAFGEQGQPYALNTGIRAAHGRSVALCDADDEVAPGWVAHMGDALERQDFVACSIDACKLNPGQHQGHEQEKGLQKIWYPPWLNHAGGGTVGFTKKLFEEVGDFDPSLPYLHDTDFCFRAQMKGYQLHFVPDAVLYMRMRGDLYRHYRQSFNFAEYNVILAKRYWRPGEDKAVFWKTYLRDWWHLARDVRALRRDFNRIWWVWRLGRQMGRLKGVVIHQGVPV